MSLHIWASLGPQGSLKPQAEGNKPFRAGQANARRPSTGTLNEKIVGPRDGQAWAASGLKSRVALDVGTVIPPSQGYCERVKR